MWAAGRVGQEAWMGGLPTEAAPQSQQVVLRGALSP